MDCRNKCGNDDNYRILKSKLVIRGLVPRIHVNEYIQPLDNKPDNGMAM